jgi:hypothetical protein
VATVPVFSATVQRNASTGALQALRCGAQPLAPVGSGTSADQASISVNTCGDSFHTLNHFIQEVIEARTTELDTRKT